MNPVKSSYLATIDGDTHERIHIRDILYKRQDDEDCNNDVNQNQNTQDDSANTDGDDNNNKIARGNLTVLDNATVMSILFENIAEKQETSKQIAESKPISIMDYFFSTESTEINTTGAEIAHNRKRNEKLAAVAVQYSHGEYDEKEVNIVKPINGGEIILCAGAFESPRILISSGLGASGISGGGRKVLEGGDKITTDSGVDSQNAGIASDRGGDVGASELIETGNTIHPVHPANSPPSLPVTLRGIGCNFQDHTMLPVMCIGKWWCAGDFGGDNCRRVSSSIQSNGDFLRQSIVDDKTNASDLTGNTATSTATSSSSAGVFGSALNTMCIAAVASMVSVLSIYMGEGAPQILEYIHDMNQFERYALYLGLTQVGVLVIVVLYNLYAREKTENASTNGGNRYPLNCVHGYVNLDEKGDLLPAHSTVPPRYLSSPVTC